MLLLWLSFKVRGVYLTIWFRWITAQQPTSLPCPADNGLVTGWKLLRGQIWHCTKNHILQVLEYHGKLKKTKQTSCFHQSLGSKKECISHLWKFQNKNFSVISKYHLSISFLAQKNPYFPPPKSSRQWLFS